jgi:hypothetical protein
MNHFEIVKATNQVVTIQHLEYIFQPTDPNHPVPGTGVLFHRAFWADVMVTERMYGVTIVLNRMSGANWMGWPDVDLSGPYSNVFRCVQECWGSNETADSMEDFVDSLIGDEDAIRRWNHRGLKGSAY